MATEGTLTPSEYITHHLTFNTKAIGEGSFWAINMDSLVMGVLLGIISMALIWMVARKATAGVPSKGQAFVELMFGFIDDQVKNIFHGDRHAFIAPKFVPVIVISSPTFPEFGFILVICGIGVAGIKKLRLSMSATL